MEFPPPGGWFNREKTPKEQEELQQSEEERRIQDVIGLAEWDKEITAQQTEQEKEQLRLRNEAVEREKEALTQLVIEDPLTKASSRVAFFAELEHSLKMVERNILTKVSVILFDLDHFKPINDTFGHAAGDEVLVRVVGLVKSALRGTDMVARLGGDEFVVLMPGADEAQALAAGEKFRALLDADPELKHFGVTASLGVCSADAATAADPETVLKRADAAAYASKEAGRNRVTAYEEHMKMRERGKREGGEA